MTAQGLNLCFTGPAYGSIKPALVLHRASLWLHRAAPMVHRASIWLHGACTYAAQGRHMAAQGLHWILTITSVNNIDIGVEFSARAHMTAQGFEFSATSVHPKSSHLLSHPSFGH